ncbi:MAG: peptidoglycan-binding protein [Verrucomicrobiota bacterium]|nr:peptidoglycan-binding protein [Verrucomicrobiota bacterium]
MRTTIILLAMAFCLTALPRAQADPTVEAVQRTLKEQGFYYGAVSGTKDADTTAALRRYQIRNGLQINGELNAETRKALGVGGGRATTASPPARAIPSVAPRRVPPLPNDTSSLRDDRSPQDAPPPLEKYRARLETPGIESSVAGQGTVFSGTPYENAPPDVQGQIVARAQSVLAQRGDYRSEVDGIFGAGTSFALRAFQARFGLQPSGRFDAETLAVLGLLPGQRGPGLTAPRRRIYRGRPRNYAPDGEPIYDPR